MLVKGAPGHISRSFVLALGVFSFLTQEQYDEIQRNRWILTLSLYDLPMTAQMTITKLLKQNDTSQFDFLLCK